MKTLVVVRHASAAQLQPDLGDHERPITAEGVEKTAKAIHFLTSQAFKPQLILTSTAKRALQTAQLLASGLGLEPDHIQAEAHLYLTDEYNLLETVCLQADECDELMLVGHNPGLSDFVNLFLKTPLDWLPTSAVVGLTFKTSHWEKIPKARAKLSFMAPPFK